MKRSTADVLYEGLMAGLLGAVAVALFFGVVNLIAGRDFFWTAAVLGQPLVGGPPSDGTVEVTAAPVFAYNGMHVLVFLVLGFGASWLVLETERHPELWYFGAFFFVALMLYHVALMAAFSYQAEVPWSLPWVQVMVGMFFGTAAMSAWFARLHPGLVHEVQEHEDPEFRSEETQRSKQD